RGLELVEIDRALARTVEEHREGRSVAAGERDVVDGESEALHDRGEIGADRRDSVGHGHLLPSSRPPKRTGSSQQIRSTKCVGTRPTLAWPLDARTVRAPVGHLADLCVDEARGHYQT